ncbi:Cysteine-rich secretory protein family protein [Roseovarius nanhaiticus]|uniref:Cysteine-rich secretory protein family protein n=1 Tax=Roseovarius nanhaiticus TaxID=573024 RepID=A0A1N7HFW2_9RHOB|nr:CAP domain-containing protein [Roseovarius nanhaiticus]SEK97311.1 Cysteine-rich secretory protein family protein [Roseovarius nanhaiticus]SIS23732.1 Cysteine-rich secretory protein family protein [Roseovarius nanhaiticus]
MRHLLLAYLICLLPAASFAAEDVSAAASPALSEIRGRNNLPPLETSAALARAASAHAEDMATNGFFSHTGSNGSGIGDRARAAGYGFCFIAENIAKGQGSLDQVIEGWMGSTGHRRNILAENAREFAVARGDGAIWVMVLGRPGC